MSCLTAVGPSSDAVGEGILGTREKSFIVGDLGRSKVFVKGSAIKDLGNIHSQGVPVIAASIRLLVGLGGADCPLELEDECSYSGNRVFPYLITFSLATVGWSRG